MTSPHTAFDAMTEAENELGDNAAHTALDAMVEADTGYGGSD